MLDNVPTRPESPPEPTTPKRAPRKRKTMSDESPSKRAQREEDEAAALAEAYRREQQAMMNNSDMYDTSHLLQKKREEQEAAAAQESGEAWQGEQETSHREEEPPQQETPAEVPGTPAAEPPMDNLGFDTSDPKNMSWDAMNGQDSPGDPGPPSMGAPSPLPDDDDHHDDDFDPPQEEDIPEEEMGEEETIEEFEDRVLNKRALQLSNILKEKFASKEAVIFNNVSRGNSRKQAAQKFYSMLVLQKMMAVEVSQPGSYGDISISRGPKFDTAVF
ncbi:Uncharacterized protein FKW44_012822 [Caligus rogercresseyi]|uniref:Rad21/Rec8-like protein C-terminal eukaryotic domain-containing protein n=1 Tax=Caligus rogercresseyi TaxID=217165 RepID=A0A7T8HK79_CALRO|nr:Uncharacterized protein FKW44_012822 [Caligus rogercresseyi]